MAIIIGNAQKLGFLLRTGGRSIVKASGGGLYVVGIDSEASPWAIAVWYSSDGNNWTEKDAGNRPTSAAIWGVCVALDSSDILHIFYHNYTGEEYDYTTFDTSIDQWNGGSPASIEKIADQDQGPALMFFSFVGISIDSNDKPHVVFNDSAKIHGTYYDTIWYSNKVSASWKTPIEIEGKTAEKLCSKARITLNDSDIPLIVYINRTDSEVTAAKGNQNDASSFTLKDVYTPVRDYAISIAVDGDDNAWIFYQDSDYIGYIAKQSLNWTDAWTIVSLGYALYPFSLAIDGTMVYAFYFKTGGVGTCYNKYDGSSWSGEQILDVGEMAYPLARWAQNNNFSYDAGIDYVLTNLSGGVPVDLYWNKLAFDGGSFVPDGTKVYALVMGD